MMWPFKKKGIRCGTSRPRSRWSLIVGVNFASKDVSIAFQPFARAKDTTQALRSWIIRTVAKINHSFVRRKMIRVKYSCL